MLIKDNPYIPATDRDFFILLRVGLWQEVNEHLSPNPDWEYIYRLANEQTVQGVIADGIGLYAETYPEIDINWDRYEDFLTGIGHMMRHNWSVNEVQSRICKLLNDNGVVYVVLKGQGVAQYYPKPMLRCAGDIDLLLKTSQFEKAKDLLSTIATGEIEMQQDQLHASADIGEIEVELHAEEFKTLGKAAVRHYTALKDKMLSDESYLRSYVCNGVDVKLAPMTFDAFYIFLHFVKHYYHEGLGLRQLTDWSMFFKHNARSINIEELTNYLRLFGMTTEWDTFMYFAVTYLNLPEDIATSLTIRGNRSKNIDRIVLRIWKSCKHTGNFGHTEDAANAPQGRLQSYKRDFINAHTRARKKWALSPTLAISQLGGFYQYYMKLLFCKVFHIGGQRFNK